MAIATINPANGELIKSFEALPDREIGRKLQLAAETFSTYKKTSYSQRAQMLGQAADILEGEKEFFGRVMTLEMGKPIRGAVQEVAKCASGCRYYAEHAERFLADKTVVTSADRSFVRYEPIGPVLAVMPWNFPFWQVFRFAAPVLMAGNVALLKHASNVPQTALLIEEIFQRAGFATGVFQTLLISSDKVGDVIGDPRVAAVSLTGSENAGIHVAVAAGRQIKKTVLELGGSDPFIVMPSTNLEEAVATAVRARVQNNGQSCIAAKRFILDERIADEFERLFVERMRSLKIGDPLDVATELGPLATAEGVRTLDDAVQETIRAGAKLLLGGKALGGPGNFYAATVLSDIPDDSPAAVEELFGPVAALFRAKDIDGAIRIANATQFGLGASAWTNDRSEQERFINEIEAGLVFINGMVASDVRLPFGGTKRSGIGRELGVYGIREFTNIKTVFIQ